MRLRRATRPGRSSGKSKPKKLATGRRNVSEVRPSANGNAPHPTPPHPTRTTLPRKKAPGPPPFVLPHAPTNRLDDYRHTGTSLNGIRPPLFRVDPVLLELPYERTARLFGTGTACPCFCTILTAASCAISCTVCSWESSSATRRRCAPQRQVSPTESLHTFSLPSPFPPALPVPLVLPRPRSQPETRSSDVPRRDMAGQD